jgi:AcrR family transcriptional regulator
MRAQPRKQQLIDTAFTLFNEHGYHATGIDWILNQSGVAKATLYKHFASKDDLILAVLKQRHDNLYASTKSMLEKASEESDCPVLQVFDHLHDWFNDKHYFGCNFIKACAEYADESSEIHRYAAGHKESMRELLLEYLDDPNLELRRWQAEALSLLIDGAIVSAQVCGSKNAALTARTAAEHLLAQR